MHAVHVAAGNGLDKWAKLSFACRLPAGRMCCGIRQHLLHCFMASEYMTSKYTTRVFRVEHGRA